MNATFDGALGHFTDANNFSDNPAVTTIILGDSITWQAENNAGHWHTVTQTDSDCSTNPGCGFLAGGFNSGNFGNCTSCPTSYSTSSDSKISAAASTPGTYFYLCAVHGRPMEGTFIVLAHGSADHWQIVGSPGTSPQGNQFTITVRALDRNGNVDTGFNGTATLSASGNSTIPVSISVNSGSGSANVILRTTGVQSVSASGNGLSSATSFVNVTATHFVVTAPATAKAGTGISVSVTAENPSNAVVAGFADTVQLTSSDGAAVISPPSQTLTGGAGSFSVTFNTVAGQTLTASDTSVGGVTGSASVTVNPAGCVTADQSFSNPALIDISDVSNANPFPSSVTVSGLSGQVVGKVTLTLHGLQHSFPSDLDMVLVAPGGQTLTLMSFAVENPITKTPIELTFDDTAANPVPQTTSGTFLAGSYRPTAYTVSGRPTLGTIPPAPPTPYPLPAPAGTNTLASAFGGISPNGTWSLYIRDNVGGDFGQVDSGWTLTITPAYDTSSSGPIQNTTPILFTTTGNSGGTASSSPYPSSIDVSGLPGNIQNVSLLLNGFNDPSCPTGVAFLLEGPQGQLIVPMSLVGPCIGAANNVNLTLDDDAPTVLPAYPGAISSGIYKPSSYLQSHFSVAPVFSSPAPVGPYSASQLAATDGTATFSSAFKGMDPNGTWKLYVLYQPNLCCIPADSGQLTGGWSLRFELQCPTDTTNTLSSNLNPSTFAAAVTFNSHLTSGNGTPTGTVTFTDTTTSTGLGTATLDGSGNASVTVSNLSVGSHIISADYNTNYRDTTTFAPSTSNNVTQVVNKAASAVALTSSVNPTRFNQSTTFKATVTGPGGTPTGTVTFTDTTTSTVLGGGPKTVVAGVATLPVSILSVGSHVITATYNGDGNYLGHVSSPVTQVVNAAATTTALGTSGTPSVYRSNVTFTATVTTSAPGAGAPFGTVNFFDNGAPLGSGILTAAGANSSTASFSTSTLTAGSHSITAVFAGSTDFVTSTSGVLTQVVNKATLSNTLTSSSDPSQFKHSVTFTAILSSLGGAETGTLTLTNAGATLAGPVPVPANHHIIFSTSALTVGVHAITSVYSGDANFNASTVGITPAPPGPNQVVNPETTTSSVAATVNSAPATSSTFGQAVTFTATVSASIGIPTGTVQFLDNGSLIGTNTLDNTGSATFTTSALAVGNHPITVSYLSDGNFAASTSSPLSFDVLKASTTTTVASSNLQQLFRHTVTFTATVSSSGGTPNGGTVQFMNNGGPLGAPVAVVSGHATLKVTLGIIGRHTIQAVYSGNSSFSGSTSAVLDQYRTPKPH